MRAQWKSALSTIVFSVPSPVRALHYANIAINTLLLIFVTEFLAVPYFDNASGVVYTRVGALSPDAAKIVVRHPPTTNATENLVRVSWRQVNTNAPIDAPWRPGPVANLTAETDWVQTVRLSSLWPSTTYECRLPSAARFSFTCSLSQTDRLEDANEGANSTVLPYPTQPIHFRTFPDSRLYSGYNFRFLASSCMTPNFPYTPLQSRRIKGFDLLADYLWPNSKTIAVSKVSAQSLSDPVSSTTSEVVPAAESSDSENVTAPVAQPVTPPPEPLENPIPPTEFMIFMGDFIYADVPVYYGDDKEAYRRFYRRNYNSPSFRKVYERLRTFLFDA